MDKSGYMLRQRSLMKTWTSSFFAIDPVSHTLRQYDDGKPVTEADWEKPTSVMNLVNCNAFTVDELGEFGERGRMLDAVFEREHTFQLREVDPRTDAAVVLSLACSSEIELEEWLQAIDLACSLGQMVDELEMNPKLIDAQLTDVPHHSRSSSDPAPVASSFSRDLFKSFPEALQPPSTDAPVGDDKPGVVPANPASVQRRAAAVGIATGDMMQRIEKLEGNSRERLEDLANNKYTAKCRLLELEKHARSQLSENALSLQALRQADTQSRAQLAATNEDVVALEKFIRASTRLQSEATAAFNAARSQVLAAATLLRKRYADSRSPSANAYIALLNKHFPEPAAVTRALAGGDAAALAAPAVEYSTFDVLAFYSEYYDTVHLPKELELNRRRHAKLTIWKQMVAGVQDIQNVERASVELELIISEIRHALDAPVPLNFTASGADTLSSIVRLQSALPTVGNTDAPLKKVPSSNTITALLNASTQTPPPTSIPSDFASVASLSAMRAVLPAAMVNMLTDTQSCPSGSDAEKNDRVVIYAQFWKQLLLTIAQLRFFRWHESNSRRELESALQSRETLALFRSQQVTATPKA